MRDRLDRIRHPTKIPQTGPANTWGGVLTNRRWKASPMTYMADGKQFVAIAAGSNILVFALP